MSSFRKIGNCEIGENCIIGKNVILGYPSRKTIKKNGDMSTSKGCKIGDNAIIRDNTIIYEGAEIGDNLETGHNVVVREDTEIGDDCKIGNYVVVEWGAKIGNNVNLQGHITIGENSDIGNDVFIGPFVVNVGGDALGRSSPKGGRPARIRDGARIGAGTKLAPEITIGKNSYVGMGSTVVKDVPDEHFVLGSPARVIKKIDKNFKNYANEGK